MEVATQQNSTLVELESQQNDLLARLDDLDHRICEVLKEWGSIRKVDLTEASCGVEASDLLGIAPDTTMPSQQSLIPNP